MDLQIEEDAPANPLVEASQSFSQDSDLIYGSSSQADNSDNRVSLLTASPSLSHSPLLCVPSPAPVDPALSTPRTAEDVDTSTTVQSGSSPTPTTPRPNQRNGAAPLSSLSPLLLPPFSPPTFTDTLPQAPQDANVSPTPAVIWSPAHPAAPRASVPELSSPTPSLETLGNHMPS